MSEETTLQQHTDRYDLQALYETSRLLSTSLDLDFVLNNLLLTAMSKLMTTRGAVLLYEPLEDACHVAARKGRVQFEADERITLNKKPGEVILQGEALPAPLAERNLAIALPIVFARRKIGWLVLGPKATGEPFTMDELDFMRSLVNMSSSAVHNALLVKELQQANRDLDAKIQALNTLFDLSQEFNATLDRQRLAKLLSYALMGQMMVQRYLFLMRSDAEEDGPVHVVTVKGVQKDVLSPDVRTQLCEMESPLRLDDEDELPSAAQVLREQGLALVLPIRHQGETAALLGLGPKMSGADYEAGDIEFLYALGNLAFVSVQNTYLVEEQVEKRRMEEEMRLAQDIQERLLPSQIPSAEGLKVAGRAQPSREVGGDYFDVVELSGGRLLIAIADVTGKGVPAALLMSNVQACLHALLPIDLTLEQATTRINEVICDNTDADKFITFFHGIYEPEAQTLRYVNAGHDPPMLVREHGVIERLDEGGLLLGVMRSAPYESRTIELVPGDVVALFTDGVTEAMNADEELYGEERLAECLRAHREESPDEILRAVREDVLGFAERPEVLSDDLTLVVAKVT